MSEILEGIDTLVQRAVEKGGSLAEVRRRIRSEQYKQRLAERIETAANEYLNSNGERGDFRPARFWLSGQSDKLARIWRQPGVEAQERQKIFAEWMAAQDKLDEIDKRHGSLGDKFRAFDFSAEVVLRHLDPLSPESNYLGGIIGEDMGDKA